jgi:hypothetical protein
VKNPGADALPLLLANLGVLYTYSLHHLYHILRQDAIPGITARRRKISVARGEKLRIQTGHRTRIDMGGKDWEGLVYSVRHC